MLIPFGIQRVFTRLGRVTLAGAVDADLAERIGQTWRKENEAIRNIRRC